MRNFIDNLMRGGKPEYITVGELDMYGEFLYEWIPYLLLKLLVLNKQNRFDFLHVITSI